MSSHVTCNMHTDVSFKQRYIKYQSAFIFSSYKTISVEERTTTACPNNDCQRHFILGWLRKHLLAVHQIHLITIQSDLGSVFRLQACRNECLCVPSSTGWNWFRLMFLSFGSKSMKPKPTVHARRQRIFSRLVILAVSSLVRSCFPLKRCSGTADLLWAMFR